MQQLHLGGQTQEEAADEAAGQDDVPFDEVGGLGGVGRGDVSGSELSNLSSASCLSAESIKNVFVFLQSTRLMYQPAGVVLLTAH